MDNPMDALLDDTGHAPRQAWKMAGTVGGALGAAGGRWLLNRARRRVSDHGDVPLNPGDERMGWANALMWSVVLAVGATLGRLLTQRALAALWTRRTHRPVKAMPS